MRTKFNVILTLFLAFTVQLTFAQQKTVTGTVSDDQGLPLPGVNVVIQGTSTGTQTDFDGNYTIDVAQGKTLVFTYIGFATQEKEVGASSNISVTLQASASELDQVVVTAFGGSKQKRATTYATTTLDSEDLNKVTSSSIFENLSGKIAGVDITAPAQPGASSKVILRGFGSITGSNEPLYVVDGTPINSSSTGMSSGNRTYDGGNGISDIDPTSIAKMTVLKGAAATALYGKRAANGAILITTKRGSKEGKLSVNISSSVDFSEVSRIPHLQNGWGAGWQGLGYSSLPNGGNGASNENGSWGPAFNGQVRPWGQIVDNAQQTKPYSPLKDNIREFYDVGNTYTNSVRVSGGDDKSDFSLNVSNLNSDGVIPTDADKLDRRVFNFNGGLHGEKLSARISANYIHKDQNAVNTGQGDTGGQGATFPQELIQIPRDVSFVDLKDYKNNPFNTPGNYFTPYSQNPYFLLNENSTNIMEDRFFGNMNFKYDFADYLSAVWQIGGDIRNERVRSHGAIVNYPEGSAQDLLGAAPIPGGVSELKRTRKLYDTYFNLNYDQELTDDINLNVLAGINYSERQSSLLNVAITGLDIPNYYELGNTANRPVVQQSDLKRRTYGLYGQAELSYLNRYFLNITGRNDWSSTLPIDNNSFFYPSASLSAIVIDNNDTYLKLRASLARVGNDTDPYLTDSKLIQGVAGAYFGDITSPIGGVNGYELSSQLGNSSLKPETTDELEVGFESSFFQKRVNLDVSVYNRKTKDLILNLPIDPSTGYTRFAGNFADLRNRGIEAVLSVTPIRSNDVRWDINYTFTKNKNEVTKLNTGEGGKLLIQGAYGTNFYAVKGQPLGVFYATVPKTNDEGQYIANSDGFYESSDKEQPIGTSQRDFIMGLSSSLSYKNLSLSGSLDWKKGGKMYSYTNRLENFTGNAISTTFNDRNPFIIPNSVVENKDGTYSENTTPIGYTDVTNFYNAQQNAPIEASHVIDKSFVRLKTVSLTYTVDKDFMQNIGLQSASLTLYGKNLFMWTPDENPYVDPEISTYGSDLTSEFGEFAGNPAQRSYGVKINIGL